MRDVGLYLQDIIEAIDRIEAYMDEVTEDSFFEDVEKQDSVIRRLEIIGEAVKNIPKSLRAKYPDVPWRNVAGLRDVLIHAYAYVNIERVWKVIKQDLPPLKGRVEEILRDNI